MANLCLSICVIFLFSSPISQIIYWKSYSDVSLPFCPTTPCDRRDILTSTVPILFPTFYAPETLSHLPSPEILDSGPSFAFFPGLRHVLFLIDKGHLTHIYVNLFPVIFNSWFHNKFRHKKKASQMLTFYIQTVQLSNQENNIHSMLLSNLHTSFKFQ